MVRKTKYTIGYGKPPRHSRFKPGRSGNPKGRPKGARSFSALLDEELKQSILVTEGGWTRKLSKLLAVDCLCEGHEGRPTSVAVHRQSQRHAQRLDRRSSRCAGSTRSNSYRGLRTTPAQG